jgi:hypothetical protein
MNKYERRMARRSYYSKPTQVILGLLILVSIILMFKETVIGIALFAIVAIVTWRGRQWNRVHVLRSEGEMRQQSIMEGAMRNAMPRQPVQQQPGQPTLEGKLTELARLRKSGQVSDEEYAAARARIIDSL